MKSEKLQDGGVNPVNSAVKRNINIVYVRNKYKYAITMPLVHLINSDREWRGDGVGGAPAKWTGPIGFRN